MSPTVVTDEVRELLDRIRGMLPGQAIREVRMFGAIAVMVDDAMAVAVNKDLSLLVRVDPAEDARLIEDSHATRAEMGAGRSMGEGWIRVDRLALRTEQGLNHWVTCATRYLSRRRHDSASR